MEARSLVREEHARRAAMIFSKNKPWKSVRWWLSVVLIVGSVVAALVLPRNPQTPISNTENVVLIIVDTLRADHLGTYGYSRDTSPNIDRLAAKSTVFETAYSHSPWTMPSIASILTSLPPRDHGITNWKQPLALKHTTIAERLLERGYHTEAFVSHVILRPSYQFNQGFKNYDTTVLKLGDPKRITTSRELSDRFIKSLDSEIEQPFFAWLHYFDPHGDYIAHENIDFGEREIDLYDAEIHYTDEQIGRVFDALERRDLWKNTSVIFVADHGEEFGDHGRREHTNTLYEELLRIPLIVYVPGYQAQRISTIVSESDIAPTICRLLGVPISRDFTGEAFEIGFDRLYAPRNRTIFAETRRHADKRGIRQDQWKYIEDIKGQKNYLFDIAADPYERRNLAKQRPGISKRLQSAIDNHYSLNHIDAEEHAMDDVLREQLESLGYL